MRTRRLTVCIEHGELVIRIGIDTLKVATDECELFYNGEKDRSDVVVTNPNEWAKDVVRELEREEENGTTLVTTMLDKAFSEAVDGGSLAVAHDGEESPR